MYYLSFIDLTYKACGSGCIETCDNINKESKEKCHVQFGEGCFCPEDYVLHNSTCVNRKKCSVCDEEGHIEGDIWYSDKCTTCSCHQNRVNCQKIECPTLDTICEENMTPKLVPGTETDCCPKYLCSKYIIIIIIIFFNCFIISPLFFIL